MGARHPTHPQRADADVAPHNLQSACPGVKLTGCARAVQWPAPFNDHVSYGTGYPASVALEDGTMVTVTGNTPLYSPQGLRYGRPHMERAGHPVVPALVAVTPGGMGTERKES